MMKTIGPTAEETTPLMRRMQQDYKKREVHVRKQVRNTVGGKTPAH